MILRGLAQLVSIVLHPLLLLTYILLLLMWANPYYFGASKFQPSSILLYNVIFTTFFLPALATVLLRATGLIASLQMEDKQDRTGPFIIAGMFYLWIFWNLFQNANVAPRIFVSFVLGATISLFLAFFINIFSKISLHTTGMGGLLAVVAILTADARTVVNMPMVLMVVILLAGLVGTSRLILDAHEPSEVYGGYFIGFIAQLAAFRFIMM